MLCFAFSWIFFLTFCSKLDIYAAFHMPLPQFCCNLTVDLSFWLLYTFNGFSLYDPCMLATFACHFAYLYVCVWHVHFNTAALWNPCLQRSVQNGCVNLQLCYSLSCIFLFSFSSLLFSIAFLHSFSNHHCGCYSGRLFITFGVIKWNEIESVVLNFMGNFLVQTVRG